MMTCMFVQLTWISLVIGPLIARARDSDSGGWLTQPVATIIGGSAVALGALLGFLAAWMSHRRELESGRHERYSKAAEQLSDKHKSVRLAGAYSMAALANEWHKARRHTYRDTAIEILCAYLRLPHEGETDDSTRFAIATIIRENIDKSVRHRWPGKSINFVKADLSQVNFEGADLSGAKLQDCHFHQANLMNADLRKAELAGADFSEAVLTRANISNTNLAGCNLTDAIMYDCKLRNSKFDPGIRMAGREINYQAIDMRGAILAGSDLRGADLSMVEMHMDHPPLAQTFLARPAEKNVPKALMEKEKRIRYNSKTKWPEYLTDIEKVIRYQIKENFLGGAPPPARWWDRPA